MERDRWALQAAPPPSSKVSNAAWRGVACDARWIWSLQCRLLAVLHLGRGIQIKQKVTARQSRNHKQEDQSQPNSISCTQRTLRNAGDTKL